MRFLPGRYEQTDGSRLVLVLPPQHQEPVAIAFAEPVPSLGLLPLQDADHTPAAVVVDGSDLARRPDEGDDRVPPLRVHVHDMLAVAVIGGLPEPLLPEARMPNELFHA